MMRSWPLVRGLSILLQFSEQLSLGLQSTDPVRHCSGAVLMSNNPNNHPNQIQLVETKEEKDHVIVSWIKSQVENHPGFLPFVRSRAKPQCVSEILEQYNIITAMLQQLARQPTAIDCDGAPGCTVKTVRFNHRSTLTLDY